MLGAKKFQCAIKAGQGLLCQSLSPAHLRPSLTFRWGSTLSAKLGVLTMQPQKWGQLSSEYFLCLHSCLFFAFPSEKSCHAVCYRWLCLTTLL